MAQVPDMPSRPPLSPIAIDDGFLGSTAIFFRVKPGVVLKAPVCRQEDLVIRLRESVASGLSNEKKILARLGDHPRITKYLGWHDEFPTGLLFVEASPGSLQSFLDDPNRDISLSVRKSLFRQATEAIAYIHSRDVIHSDLRPDNFLVHTIGSTDFDLMLCDFGGSACEEIGIPGENLPDDGFFDPNSGWTTTVTTDIFSLGSVLYTIVSGHWPYREPPCGLFTSREEVEEYESRVNGFFKEGIFPDTKGLYGGEIILGCWTGQYSSANDILRAVDALESLTSDSETC
ncbi:hypothetical protein MRS44_009445 [Fusarium solani]|uniref:EKC/KEOPS complex subunit BUD32 n=1 Tax=Fusarium solani TaxID=169388 RepID=A0A9P9G8R2_FUSSL|nr:kinase-like domain-containing protein [Fusarium solani]KAH7235105.1 kinase-like domain-containing protein [Fusarium solani]KAJ3464659.1 hypothetical protein MRS44_009445 [Fusarium solani]